MADMKEYAVAALIIGGGWMAVSVLAAIVGGIWDAVQQKRRSRQAWRDFERQYGPRG
jgi:hypothetical protein